MDMGFWLLFFLNGDVFIALKHGYGLIAFFFPFLNGDGPIPLKHGNRL